MFQVSLNSTCSENRVNHRVIIIFILFYLKWSWFPLTCLPGECRGGWCRSCPGTGCRTPPRWGSVWWCPRGSGPRYILSPEEEKDRRMRRRRHFTAKSPSIQGSSVTPGSVAVLFTLSANLPNFRRNIIKPRTRRRIEAKLRLLTRTAVQSHFDPNQQPLAPWFKLVPTGCLLANPASHAPSPPNNARWSTGTFGWANGKTPGLPSPAQTRVTDTLKKKTRL